MSDGPYRLREHVSCIVERAMTPAEGEWLTWRPARNEVELSLELFEANLPDVALDDAAADLHRLEDDVLALHAVVDGEVAAEGGVLRQGGRVAEELLAAG